ncbi:MAG: class C sortase [Oscillospiraceae bacterium]|nr:class C sortase [Oscillospiraceae bacterium]
MRKHLSTIIVVLALIIGVSLILYPMASDLLNTLAHKQAINSYISHVDTMTPEESNEMFEAALEYNRQLARNFPSTLYLSSEEDLEKYYNTLDITGTGIMGYIIIPAIDVNLPIYHGTSESVLQVGVGHLDGSSLPVGGESSHIFLSGHRGLPSATLFTNLPKLVIGDIFTIQVLKETMAYEVDDIQVVEPYVLNFSKIERGMDYCTLITCTPYGINTHRLLVRGHRIETPPDGTLSLKATRSEAQIVDLLWNILFAEVPIMMITIVVIFVSRRKKRS